MQAVHSVRFETPFLGRGPQFEDPQLKTLQPHIDKAFQEMNLAIENKNARMIRVQERMNKGSVLKIVAFFRIVSFAVLSWVSPTKSWRNSFTAKAVAGFALPELYSPGNSTKREEWRQLNAQKQDLDTLKVIFSDATQLKAWIETKKTHMIAAQRMAENNANAQAEQMGMEVVAESEPPVVSDRAAFAWGLRDVGFLNL